MPKVTSLPGDSSTRDAACRIASRKLSEGRITWSEGMTAMIASGSCRETKSAASPMQGAVSRLQGSPTRPASGTCGSCRRTASSSRPAVTTITRSGGTRPSSRSTVSSSSVVAPASGRSCLGRAARLAGQKRVPDPPAITMACSMGCISPSGVCRAVGAVHADGGRWIVNGGGGLFSRPPRLVGRAACLTPAGRESQSRR